MPDSSSVGSVALVAASGDEAWCGLAGDILRAIAPHSEADPWAILAHFLAAFGNVVGRRAHFVVEATRHYTNLNVLIVGETSTSRKGTAWGHVQRLFEAAAPDWAANRVQRGLSSGEGLIWAVRDPSGPDDPGVKDKRLLVVETEFAFPLRTMQRETNTLSPVIRIAWDGVPVLSVLTKNAPARATAPLVSIIGHITEEELREKFDRLELANGFGNRFLFFLVRRARKLPLGGQVSHDVLTSLIERLRAAVTFASSVDRLEFEEDARAYWCEIYDVLSEGRPGLFGAVTARAAPQVLRLACLYALLDCSATIRTEHLRAGLAVWNYAEASASRIFSARTGHSVADKLVRQLQARGSTGMTETEIRDYFQHRKTVEIDRAIDRLEQQNMVTSVSEPTGGRPATRWVATEATKATKGPDGGRQGGDA